MRLITMFAVLTLSACGIYQSIPNSSEDTGSDVSDSGTRDMSGDVADDVRTPDLSSDDAGNDVVSTADMSPDLETSLCTPSCATDRVCVDATCKTPNGGPCSQNSDCVAACNSNVCGPGRALWMWDYSQVTNSVDGQALLQFASNKGVTSIFVEAEAIMYESGGPEATHENLGTFITTATTLDIEVYLLFGFAGWALPQNHAEIAGLIQIVNSFTQNTARPAGIILDVEPHTLAEWQDDPGPLGTGLVGMYAAVKNEITTDLPIFATIPFWYDTVMISTDNGAAPLHQLVLEVADGIALMNYRDTAAGADGLIMHAETEIAAAETLGKRVIVNVETTCGLLDKTTFCEEGEQVMNQEIDMFLLGNTDALFLTAIGIHDYTAYQILPP